MNIREVENPKFTDLISWLSLIPEEKSSSSRADRLKDIKLIGSGKGAIAAILRYLIEKKIIINKLDEVLVPDWLGYWVYNQMQPWVFPAKKFSDRTKVIFVYHQYGFPQDMDKIMDFANDKKLIVIEDCAHAVESYYKGKPLGSFGDFSIYSFSKWVFCFALGGVWSKFIDFSDYAERLIKKTPFGLTLFKDATNLFSDISSATDRHWFVGSSNLLINMAYSVYGEALKTSYLSRRLLDLKLSEEIAIRQKRYKFFLERTENFGICRHLEKDGITPYVIPIICPDEKNNQIVTALKNEKIMSGIYRFDVNRNLLSPNFVSCVWVPCHGGISNNKFDAITEIILKTLN